jgi:amidase
MVKDYDFLLTPAAPGEAPVGIGHTGNPVFTKVWSVLGVPCVSVPAYKGATGLPIGVQIIGAYGSDTATLAWADWVHRRLSSA